MRIDFVYVETPDGKVPVNPEALEYIDPSVSDVGVVLHLKSGGVLGTKMTLAQAIQAFSPMNIAGGR